MPVTVHKQGLAGSDVHTAAAEKSYQFKKLFVMYSKCHKVMNKCGDVSNEELIQLRKFFIHSEKIKISFLSEIKYKSM